MKPRSNFTVTFEKAGTYDYLCVVRPWMCGVVTVKYKNSVLNHTL